LYSDPNQNPFAAAGVGKSLEWGGNDNDASAKTVRLRERLNEADTERRKDMDAADQRERAAEIRREERLKKIAYMNDMPDHTPAGTGECNCNAENLPMENILFLTNLLVPISSR
jgi:hypothetical protein